MPLAILIFISFISFGGLALTYIFDDESSFLWRLAAGNIIGSAIFGTAGFILALLFGFNIASILIAMAVTMLPCFLLLDTDRRRTFIHDWAKAKGKLQGANLKKATRFLYYVFFLVLFIAFFERAMFETAQGIFTGGSNNLGDLPFHLGAIFSFTDGNNFPPQNPSFAGARFSYPFIVDFITACFVKIGFGLRDSMLVQNISWAFSLLIIFERFVYKLTNDRLASKIAPALLFFSGGLGFIWFFGDYWAQGKSFFDFIWSLPKDYSIGQDFRWGNSMVTLFMTQRSFLVGMPLTMIVLSYLWKIFTEKTQTHKDLKSILSTFHFPLSTFIVGLIAGSLPLIHLHSLAVLFVVTLFLFATKPSKWREWIAFGFGVGVIAIPQLIWSLSGSATETSKFFGFHFGWDSGETNFIWFWIKNTGILFAMIATGIYLVYSRPEDNDAIVEAAKGQKVKKDKHTVDSSIVPDPSSILLFYIPFGFLFLLANATKLAPWEWDNIKVLIFWYVGSLPFVVIVLTWMWRRSGSLKVLMALCFGILIFSGVLDVWRTASAQINMKVFEADAVTLAERIKQRTPPNSLFLNAPTYNSAVVLSGRLSLMRYTGHLFSHGIDYSDRERDVKIIYSGGTAASMLLQKYGIDYVLISPEEKNAAGANEAFFSQFPVVAEAGQYKVYKIK